MDRARLRKVLLAVLLPAGAVCASALLLLTRADCKVNDVFMRALPPLEESPRVILVNIDDSLIEQTGVWPSTRDIYADILVVMKELGAEAFISDLSFVDPSPPQVKADYLHETLPQYVDSDFAEIGETLAYVVDGFADGSIGRADAGVLKENVLAANEAIRERLKVSIAAASNNYDDYLAKCLSFFENACLTLWMQSGYDMSGVDVDYLEQVLALGNAVSDGDTRTPEFDSVQPALDLLIKHSASAGFVNSYPDSDGYLRRLNLVAKYNGTYYGQLVFVPLLRHFGNPQVVVSNSAITLKDAQVAPGRREDVVIPRDEHGSVIVKFPRKAYAQYNQISAWNIYRLKVLEDLLVANLDAMKESGFFSVWDEDATPADLHEQCVFVREELYEGGDGDITYGLYHSLRSAFFESVERLLSGGYEGQLLDAVADDDELADFVGELFAECRSELDDLLASRAEVAEKLAGAFCIIGTTASSTTDYGLIAYQEKYPNVGVHAAMANQLLARDFVDDSPWFVGVAYALALCALYSAFCAFAASHAKKILAGAVLVAASVAAPLAVFVITKVYVGAAVPLAAITLLFLAITLIDFINTSREKKFIQEKFGAYVAPEIVSELVKNPASAEVGGESKHITALFSDVMKFSGFTETVNDEEMERARERNRAIREGRVAGEEPLTDEQAEMRGAANGAKRLVGYLNDYLGALSDAIMEQHGTIDKYVGDEIVSFFGAPVDDADNAWHACVAGIRMLQAEAEYNLKHQRDLPANKRTGQPFLLHSRVGINTGDMVVGNMGTAKKLNYTVMGNNVNLASRLEGTNKAYGSWIMCSESTWKAANARPHGDVLIARRFDCVQVVNVVQPVPIYNILGLKSELPAAQVEAAELFNKGMSWYLRGKDTPEEPKDREDLKKAYAFFKQAQQCFPQDKSSDVFLQRCYDFLINGLPSRWDGVYTMTSK